MNLPGWTLQVLLLSVFLHSVQVLMGTAGLCDNQDTIPGVDDSPQGIIDTVKEYATFETCIDPENTTEQLVRFGLFALGTLPFLLILAAFLFDLFNNAFTGAAVAALAIGVGLVALFT